MSQVSFLFKQVVEFCEVDGEKTTHVADAPNKQNILCKEKSAWEVMRTLEDFGKSLLFC